MSLNQKRKSHNQLCYFYLRHKFEDKKANCIYVIIELAWTLFFYLYFTDNVLYTIAFISNLNPRKKIKRINKEKNKRKKNKQ